MINTTLFLFAIPLNLIGYLLKHGTKIHNKLIPVIITAISCIFCFAVGSFLGNGTLVSVVNYGIQRGLFVAAMSAYGWDFIHGTKTVIKDITAQAERLISKDKEEKMDRLRIWHKTLLSNLLTVIVLSLATFIVGYANTKMGSNTIALSIDMTILAIVFVSSGVIAQDLIKKIVTKDKGLTTQYGLCFGLAAMAIGAFIMTYIAATWTVTIIAFSGFVVFSGLALFCVRYSYLPSLETKAEAMQRVMANRFKVYEGLTDDEVAIRMRGDVTHLFKNKVWGAELDLDKPIFLVKGTALTVEALANLNSPEYKLAIANAVKEFGEIIRTREVK